MSWPQIALAVASAALQYKSSQDQQRKQQDLADQMTQYRLSKSREGEAATNKFLASQQPEARAATNTAAEQAIAQGLNTSIGTAQAFEKPQNFAGKVTSDYTNRAASNEADLGNRLKTLIGNLSVIGAPAQRDFNTSLKFGDAVGSVGAANTAANNVGARYSTAIDNVQPDPYLDLAGQIAQGIGVGIAGRPKTLPIDYSLVPGSTAPSTGLKPSTIGLFNPR